VSNTEREDEVQKALEDLPAGLDDTYVRIIDQISKKDPYSRDLALRCFQWAFFAQRPLTSKELQHAVSKNLPGSDHDSNLDFVGVILEACANLIVEEPPRGRQRVMRPTHYSVQVFHGFQRASAFIIFWSTPYRRESTRGPCNDMPLVSWSS